jgi:uncharacterized protein YndB with AHSA1/START domain
MAEIVVSVDVDTSPERLWDLVVDWDRQSEWVFLTTVRGTHRDGRGVGARLEAVTGVGPLRFVDPMEVTVWDEPSRCVVRHLGRVVRGTAAFEVEPLPGGGARFTWAEWVDLPFGALGRLLFPVVRPLVELPLRRSLSRLKRIAESG